jgi:hypothetical protein
MADAARDRDQLNPPPDSIVVSIIDRKTFTYLGQFYPLFFTEVRDKLAKTRFGQPENSDLIEGKRNKIRQTPIADGWWPTNANFRLIARIGRQPSAIGLCRELENRDLKTEMCISNRVREFRIAKDQGLRIASGRAGSFRIRVFTG